MSSCGHRSRPASRPSSAGGAGAVPSLLEICARSIAIALPAGPSCALRGAVDAVYSETRPPLALAWRAWPPAAPHNKKNPCTLSIHSLSLSLSLSTHTQAPPCPSWSWCTGYGRPTSSESWSLAWLVGGRNSPPPALARRRHVWPLPLSLTRPAGSATRAFWRAWTTPSTTSRRCSTLPRAGEF